MPRKILFKYNFSLFFIKAKAYVIIDWYSPPRGQVRLSPRCNRTPEQGGGHLGRGGGTQSKEDYMTSLFVRFLTLFDERSLGIIVLHVMVPKPYRFFFDF
jgi:hypothetical protein